MVHGGAQLSAMSVRRQGGHLSRHALRTAALAFVCALAPSLARAQDATALVVLGAPPLLLAPLLAALVRRMVLHRAAGFAGSGHRFLALSLLEFGLWLAVVWLAGVVFFQESWFAVLVVGGALAAILELNRRLAGGQGSWASGAAFAAVFPSVWVVLQLLSYGCLLGWGWLAA